MPQITLYDPESQNTYIIDVTEEDARRANKASVVHNVDTVTNTIQAFSQDDDDDSQEKDYVIMNEMFTKKPWAKPLLTLESGSSSITSSDEEMKNIACESKRSSSPSCENKLPAKRKY
ncbi:glutamyl-trna reductase [Lasius niger]|uniref:Glutamyl-trna reductase n=1 Tax=Lasius niger TaxID=67767 RepID=A0A0J7KHC3_LASNI|nr:glutamyl-trna reductase [Lasius niger]